MDTFVPKHRLLLVSVNRGIGSREVYGASRYAWRVKRERVEKVEMVLASVKGVVQGVFVSKLWLDASPGEASVKNFSGFAWTHNTPRLGFEGVEAEIANQRTYLGKRVPQGLAIGQNGFRLRRGLNRGRCCPRSRIAWRRNGPGSLDSRTCPRSKRNCYRRAVRYRPTGSRSRLRSNP